MSPFRITLILLRTTWDSCLQREKRETQRGQQQQNPHKLRPKKEKRKKFYLREDQWCLPKSAIGVWGFKAFSGQGSLTLKVKSKLINLGEASSPESADSPLQGGQSQQEKGICSANKEQDERL